MAVLVVAEYDQNLLKEATLKTVTAAAAMDGDVDILIAGEDISAVTEQATKIMGIRKVISCDHPLLGRQLAEVMQALIVPLMDNYDGLLAADTTMGKNFMPRIAAKLDVMQISSIVKVDAPDTFTRPIYAGNALATVQSNDAKKIVTIRPTAFEAAATGSEAAPSELVNLTESSFRSEFISEDLSISDRPELTSAKIVVSGGRGMGSGDNFSIIETLADQLGAAVGASRAAVDAGYVPNDYQVGQTGKIVAPDLYIAVGISGAIQHLAGMSDSKIIVAINKDEDAPIFQVADYGWVADLFTAVPELSAELDKRKNS